GSEGRLGGDRFHHRSKNPRSIRAAQSGVASAVRMRHQSEYVALAVANPGDVFNRTVRVRLRDHLAAIVRVAQDHLPVLVQLAQRPFIREVAAFAMSERHSKKTAFGAAMSEW